MEQSLRRERPWGLLAGACVGLLALSPAAALAAAAVLLLALGLAWTFCSPSRWVCGFLGACLLLPPLPLPGGDSGPHPGLILAALGLGAGLARFPEWRLRLDLAPAALLFLAGVLTASTSLAMLYSGPPAALGTAGRVGLFLLSVYVFFYLRDGPGRTLSPHSLIRLLFWAGLASAAFACVDFYFQFPAPARFAAQYVWLPQAVFRRAQGVFYEASTLGSFCTFALVLIAALGARGMGARLGLRRRTLAGAALVFLTALMFSFSRAAVASLVVALAALGWIERHRLGRALRAVAGLALAGAAGVAVVYLVFPEFAGLYGARLLASGEFLAEAPNAILSRRLETWEFVWQWIRQHPGETLWGVGYKTLPYTTALGRSVVTDNMYLSLLVETGWAGLAALVSLNAAILIESCRLATRGGDDVRRLIGLWMFCFWCGQTVQMASGDILTYWRLLPAFFGVLAVGLRAEDPVPGPVL